MKGMRRIVLDNYFDYRGVDDFWVNMSLAVYHRHFILQKRSYEKTLVFWCFYFTFINFVSSLID